MLRAPHLRNVYVRIGDGMTEDSEYVFNQLADKLSCIDIAALANACYEVISSYALPDNWVAAVERGLHANPCLPINFSCMVAVQQQRQQYGNTVGQL